MKVCIITFGCQMNRLDSDLVSDLLRASGYAVVADRELADVVLYNTCSVREHAEQKVYSRLGRDAQLKDKPAIGVIGCMAQRLGDKLLKRCPAVDLVCAPGRLYMLPELIENVSAGGDVLALDPLRTESLDSDSEKRLEQIDMLRSASGVSRQAFLRVMRGCDKFCSYCIVPFVRGPERSRDPKHILEEAGRLIDAGRDCLTLVGQTVNSYRFAETGFGDLVRQVAGIEGLRRLDFVTSYPVDFGSDILEAMRDLPNVCTYIHCPVQSGSDRILRSMNRGYTRSEYDAFIDMAYEIMPDVAIASDFIVGFPGETEEDHEASIDLIRRSGFKNCFIFKYSPREGTQAAKKLADDVPEEIKRERNNQLLEIQREEGFAHHRKRIGRSFEVLVEGRSPRFDKQQEPPSSESTQMMGRTMGNHIVLFNGPENLAGRFAKVRIAGANDLALLGELTG